LGEQNLYSKNTKEIQRKTQRTFLVRQQFFGRRQFFIAKLQSKIQRKTQTKHFRCENIFVRENFIAKIQREIQRERKGIVLVR